MKRKSLFEKLSTNVGSTSIMFILLFTGLLIFILMPVVAYTFEKTLVNLMFQDVESTLSLNTYEIYQHLEVDALAKGHLNLSPDTQEHLSDLLGGLYKHPQLETIEVVALDQVEDTIRLKVRMRLLPSLYRDIYALQEAYDFYYKVEMPMDKKEEM